MSLANPIATVLHEFETGCSRPTWSKVQVLLVGTFLARGQRTVAAALQHIGVHDAPNFSLYLSGTQPHPLVGAGVGSPPAAPAGADLYRSGR